MLRIPRPRMIGVFTTLVLVLGAAAARAKPCGDDVNGKDVPCACGDMVVSDVALGDDPVVQAPCRRDGLVVRAVDAPRGVTIDLRGKTIRGGKRGKGIWIVNGGPGGAHLLSTGATGAIEGFRDAIVAQGLQPLVAVSDLVVRGAQRDGLQLTGTAYEVGRVEARNCGRDGFSLRGSGWQLTETSSIGAGRYGYFVKGGDGTAGAPGRGAVAQGSKDDGFHILGSGHQLVDCVATGNGEDGVNLNGKGFRLTGCRASGNAKSGIAGVGDTFRFRANIAVDNAEDGIFVRGHFIIDEGGNEGSGNRGERGTRPAKQCDLGDQPCTP